MVTNTPVEATGAFGNPLMGFRNDLNGYSQYPYRTVVRQYIRWNEIENDESDTVQKIRDFCNTKWANLPANNIKVIPRVYLDWNSGSWQRILAGGFADDELDQSSVQRPGGAVDRAAGGGVGQ